MHSQLSSARVDSLSAVLDLVQGTSLKDRHYRKLLDRTKKALPNVQLIIGEPFAVAGG